jgi:hypothetical protein
MPWGHRDHQAFALACNDTVKGFGDTPMMFPDNHFRPHVLTERQKVCSCTVLRFKEPEAKF